MAITWSRLSVGRDEPSWGEREKKSSEDWGSEKAPQRILMQIALEHHSFSVFIVKASENTLSRSFLTYWLMTQPEAKRNNETFLYDWLENHLQTLNESELDYRDILIGQIKFNAIKRFWQK